MKLIGLTIFAAAANAGKYNKLEWVHGLDLSHKKMKLISRKLG